MDASKYLSTLAALDITNVVAYEDFFDATQAQAIDDLPKPIPFGTRDGTQYFLLSSDETLPQNKRHVFCLSFISQQDTPSLVTSINAAFELFDPIFEQETSNCSSPFPRKRNLSRNLYIADHPSVRVLTGHCTLACQPTRQLAFHSPGQCHSTCNLASDWVDCTSAPLLIYRQPERTLTTLAFM